MAATITRQSVADEVAAWPALTSEQRDQLALLLRPAVIAVREAARRARATR